MSFTVAALIAGAGMFASSRAQNKMTAANARATAEELAFRKEQAAKLDKQKEIYKQFEFKNPYEDIENVFEDLTVDKQSAEFQMEQGRQQRANIMQSLRGAAGSSGIAGLAQAMAGQGQLQARQVSADISRQEQQNRLLRAQGASAADMAFRGGEATMQEAEMSRQSTLLGVDFAGLAGANAGVQAARANEAAGRATAVQMTQDRWNTASNLYSDYTDWTNS